VTAAERRLHHKETAMAQTALDLYRSIHKSTAGYGNGPIVDGKAVSGVLYPDFVARELGKGKIRAADVTLAVGKGGVDEVQPKGGTSLFDKPYVLPGGAKNWHSFRIPVGTDIPASLIVRFTGANKTFKSDHYQIECLNPMTVDAMKGALDNFARSAIVSLVALGEVKALAPAH
jgi:Tse2 ADP-ribosyltransferase toxins